MPLKAVIFSEDELRAKCAEWQKILRLQDWIINVSIVRERDANLKGCNAEIHVTLPNRIARIHILDPIDYDPTNALPQDMEQYLVHELLHIHLYPITGQFREGPLQIAEEQAIEAISKGLIALVRKQGMKYGDQEVSQIIITGPKLNSELVTADENKEIIAILSQDEELVIKNGYGIKVIPAPTNL
jgi:hypothetical protein